MKKKIDKNHPKRPYSIGARVTAELYARYEAAAERLKVNKSELAEKAIESVLDMMEKYDYRIPLSTKLIPSQILVDNPDLPNLSDQGAKTQRFAG